MAKRTRRSSIFANCLAGLYLIWSLLVYFGTLGREGHEWWPLFLYPVIWPLSYLIKSVDEAVPLGPTASASILNDFVVGVLYIVLGTIWLWFLGWLISVGTKKLLDRPSIRGKQIHRRSHGRR